MCIKYYSTFSGFSSNCDCCVSALCELPGVGPKVADCVCLMSLDKTDAIPVDTHVWQISCRDYNIPELKKSKSLTNKAYKAIGNSLNLGSSTISGFIRIQFD